MAGIVALVIFFIIFALVKSAARSSGAGRFDRLASGGIRGRALVLAASSTPLQATRVGMRRFEMRTMTLDVEVPGRAPVVMQGTYLCPRGVEPVPGAALDVALDANGANLVVLGPGGFTGPWLNMGPPQPY